MIPKVGVRTGSAKTLCAMYLLYADSLLEVESLQIFRTHFLYSAVTCTLLSGPTYPIFSSRPRYFYESLSFNGLITTPFITIML